MDTECKICAVYKNIPETWPEQKGGSWLLEAAGGCGGLVCPPVTLTEGTPQQSRQLWLLLSFRCSWKTGTGKGIKREREGLETLRASPSTPGVTRGPAWHHVNGEGDLFWLQTGGFSSSSWFCGAQLLCPGRCRGSSCRAAAPSLRIPPGFCLLLAGNCFS